jgi:hypothetical protein
MDQGYQAFAADLEAQFSCLSYQIFARADNASRRISRLTCSYINVNKVVAFFILSSPLLSCAPGDAEETARAILKGCDNICVVIRCQSFSTRFRMEDSRRRSAEWFSANLQDTFQKIDVLCASSGVQCIVSKRSERSSNSKATLPANRTGSRFSSSTRVSPSTTSTALPSVLNASFV